MPRVDVVSREEWRAKPPNGWVPLSLPIKKVAFTVNTGTPPCETTEECIRTVQQIQDKHVNKMGMPDIAYNFLVGSDGKIYEGRGWYVKPSKATTDTECLESTIDVAYIGQFSFDDDFYPWLLYDKVCDLILDAQERDLIVKEVDLLC